MVTAIITIGSCIIGLLAFYGIYRELVIRSKRGPHCKHCGKPFILTEEDVRDGINVIRCCDDWQNLLS